MSAAVMALAETSKSYQKKIKELEDEVARLKRLNERIKDSWQKECDIHANEARRLEDEVARLQKYNDELNHSHGLLVEGADRDAQHIVDLQRELSAKRTECEGLKSDNGKLDWEVKKLRLDCSEARGYGQALYETLRRLYDGLGEVPRPPWLAG